MQSFRTRRIKEIVKAVPVIANTYRAVRWSPLVTRLTPNPRRHLNDYIKSTTDGVVHSGPFAGMKLLEHASWGDGDIAPKLLGTYEQELHPVVDSLRSRGYDAVVDIGCAEGFYAVGLARLLQDTPIFAYDINPQAREVTRTAALENGVSEARLSVGGACSPAEIARVVSSYPRLLVVSDCEGYEREMFSDPVALDALTKSDILIECHDSPNLDTTAYLSEILGRTHEIEVVVASGRNPHSFDFLADLNEIDCWQAVNENRPYRMKWLWCEAR